MRVIIVTYKFSDRFSKVIDMFLCVSVSLDAVNELYVFHIVQAKVVIVMIGPRGITLQSEFTINFYLHISNPLHDV